MLHSFHSFPVYNGRFENKTFKGWYIYINISQMKNFIKQESQINVLRYLHSLLLQWPFGNRILLSTYLNISMYQ